jgi:hypothetical protein
MRIVLVASLSVGCIAAAALAETSAPISLSQTAGAAPAFELAQAHVKRGRAHRLAAPKSKGVLDGAAEKQPEPAKGPSGGAADAFKACLEIWDAGTHMSKREWERACRRVADRINSMTMR